MQLVKIRLAPYRFGRWKTCVASVYATCAILILGLVWIMYDDIIVQWIQRTSSHIWHASSMTRDRIKYVTCELNHHVFKQWRQSLSQRLDLCEITTTLYQVWYSAVLCMILYATIRYGRSRHYRQHVSWRSFHTSSPIVHFIAFQLAIQLFAIIVVLPPSLSSSDSAIHTASPPPSIVVSSQLSGTKQNDDAAIGSTVQVVLDSPKNKNNLVGDDSSVPAAVAMPQDGNPTWTSWLIFQWNDWTQQTESTVDPPGASDTRPVVVITEQSTSNDETQLLFASSSSSSFSSLWRTITLFVLRVVQTFLQFVTRQTNIMGDSLLMLLIQGVLLGLFAIRLLVPYYPMRVTNDVLRPVLLAILGAHFLVCGPFATVTRMIYKWLTMESIPMVVLILCAAWILLSRWTQETQVNWIHTNCLHHRFASDEVLDIAKTLALPKNAANHTHVAALLRQRMSTSKNATVNVI